MNRVLVGTSGFSYASWTGTFYPPGTKPSGRLAVYAQRFDAVEINATFWKSPGAKTIRSWRDAVPETFRFALKAPMAVTHMRRLQGVDANLARFFEAAAILGPRLGPVLVQLPPTLAFDAGLLADFFGRLPGDVDVAVEPRHASFRTAEAAALLREHGVARCVNDGEADESVEPPPGRRIAYVRCRRSAYAPDDLDALAASVTGLARRGPDVYVFFRHEDRPDGTRPALAFRERVV